MDDVAAGIEGIVPSEFRDAALQQFVLLAIDDLLSMLRPP